MPATKTLDLSHNTTAFLKRLLADLNRMPVNTPTGKANRAAVVRELAKREGR